MIELNKIDRQFSFYCQKVLPLVFDESLSYYEMLCKLTEYIKTAIETVNTTVDGITELQGLYVELKDYVDNYFSELNIQEQINAKLDIMAGDGTLATIINEEIFETLNQEIVDLKADDVLIKADILSLQGSNADIIEDISDLGESINNKINSLFINVKYPIESLTALVGDGIVDETENLQDMIDYLNVNNGGTLYFPKGIYIISEPIRLYSNITLLGDYSTIKLVDDVETIPYSLFVTSGTVTENIHLEKMIIDGNRTNNVDHGTPDVNGNQNQYFSGTLLALINFTSTKFSSIKECEIKNSWGSGIWLNDCTDMNIENNVIKDYRISGLAIRNNTSIVGTSQNINILNNVISGGTVGIHNIFGCKYITISNNKLFNNKDMNRFPEYAYNGTYPNIYPDASGFVSNTDPSYSSPAFEGDGAGIELTGRYTDSSATSNEHIVIDSNISYQNEVGIRLEEETRNNVVSNNIVYNNNYGIFLFSSYSNNISDNECSYNNYGIVLERLATSIKPLSAKPELNIVSGNKISKNNYFAIKLAGASRNIITSNILSDNNVITAADGGAISISVVEAELCVKNQILNNQFISYNGYDKFGIKTDGNAHIENVVNNNIFDSLTTINQLSLSTNYINDNVGYRTKITGQAFIPSGATYVRINHSIVYAPWSGQIVVTPVTVITGNQSWYVGNVNADTFDIILNGTAATNLYFNYHINNNK